MGRFAELTHELISPTVTGVVTVGDLILTDCFISCVSTDSSLLIFAPVAFDEGYFIRVLRAAISNTENMHVKHIKSANESTVRAIDYVICFYACVISFFILLKKCSAVFL